MTAPDGRWRPMTRALLSWAAPALRVALGAAVVASLAGAPAGDAGPRAVALAAIVRGDAHGRPVVQRDANHSSVGWAHPSCEGPSLRIEPRPAGRYAPVVVVGMDGWLADRGYAAGVRSSQGRRVLVAFTRHGEPVTCAEVFAMPEGDLHVLGEVVR